MRLPLHPAVRPVVVAGGINADVLARTLAPPVLKTSNPARATVTPGGVARNVAENLARLLPAGVPVQLLGAVGSDLLGAGVLAATAEAGVDVRHVHRQPGTTGLYAAVLDQLGELHLGLAAMELTSSLTPQDLPAGVAAQWAAAVRAASLLVADANLSAQMLTWLLDTARAAGVRAVLDPVSAPKAAQLAGLALQGGLYLVTPDEAELRALAGLPPDASLHAAAGALLERGVQHVLVTRGGAGSALYSADGPPQTSSARPARVQDVTGAGDALLAGLCAALARGHDLTAAVRLGHRAAALTVESLLTVRPDMSWSLLAEGDAG